jgi:hypothetical protein
VADPVAEAAVVSAAAAEEDVEKGKPHHAQYQLLKAATPT